MKDKIIFASNNEGKIREVKEIMADYGKEILSLKEAGIDLDVEENGTTFAENALIKCRAVHELTGAMIMADDSGLSIDAFDGGPGVYSARFLGHETPYDIKNNINEIKSRNDGNNFEEKFLVWVQLWSVAI